jgi:hypothetical protein
VQPELDTLLIEVTAVASLSLYFDPSLLALCWRGLGKVCCSNVATASSTGALEASLPFVIAQLCQAIVTVARQSSVDADALLEKRLKSGRLLCSLVLRLVSLFPVAFEDCSKQLVDMLLSIHQTIHATSNTILRRKIEASLLLVVGHLL